MSRVHVVTDSSADLPKELRDELGVATVSLHIIFGDEAYRDEHDISTAGFYEKMATSGILPHTSQPSPADFVEVYKAISEPGDEIVSIHLSGKLSGTSQSAHLAKSMLEDRRIIVVDSQGVSQGLGLAVVAAAEAAREGKSADEVARIAADVAERTHYEFVVDSLEHLQRNGRIGRAAALLGGLLAVKPILTLQDGIVTPLEKVRGRSKVLPRMLEIMEERTPKDRPVVVTVIHSGVAEEAAQLEAQVRERYTVRKFLRGFIGPVVGANAGPNILGLIWYDAS